MKAIAWLVWPLSALVLTASCDDSGGGGDMGTAGGRGVPAGGRGAGGDGATTAAGAASGEHSAGASGANPSGGANVGADPIGHGGAAGTSNGGTMSDAGAGETGAGAGEGGVGGTGGAGDWLAWPSNARPSWDGSLPSSGVCSIHRVCWNSTPYTRNDFYGVWASSATDIWLGGIAATLAHFDGAVWKGITAVEDWDFAFRLIRGSSATNVWAVGWTSSKPAEQRFYRFDGTEWQRMPEPTYPVRAIWASGVNEVWTANEGKSVSHWNGTSWSTTSVGKDVTGIWGFSNTDVWVSGETVLHFNGQAWLPTGGGGSGSIWGASSGDMWTGNGAHLSAGTWAAPLKGVGSGFGQVVGATASDLFFRGTGAQPYNYYLKGNTFAAAIEFPASLVFDVWPASPSDYWIVGESSLGQASNVLHGDPAGEANAPAVGSPSYPPTEPESPYRVVGKTLDRRDGADWVPLKTFDNAFLGSKSIAFSNATVWACNGNQIHQFDGEAWTVIGSGCTFLQVDGNGHLWVHWLSQPQADVRVFNGVEWRTLDLPLPYRTGLLTEDFAVRGHEAWLLAQLTALRWNGESWDEYSLGVTPDTAPGTVTITEAGAVYFGPASLRFDP